MLFQTTPDTSSYLLLGFVMFGVVGIGFVLSIFVRMRTLRRDVEMIEELQREDETSTDPE